MTSKPEKVGEGLLAAPLGDMISSIGLAVAEANRKIGATPTGDPANDPVMLTISEAEIEINIAISMEQKTDTGAGLTLGVNAFSVNATYAKTFGFKEEASSRICVKLKAVPRSKG